MIHPTAIVHPQARLDPSVLVGPYAVIDSGVEVGPDCVIGPHAYFTGATRVGARNRFYAGVVIGEAPQDLHYKGQATAVEIGNGNVFREHVTVHRSSIEGQPTVIGSNNFLMANAHVAHNCHVGDQVIIANGALMGGHARVEDRAFVSGNCLIHQFTRVGMLAMMQGGSAVSKDVPPFTIAQGINGVCGLNTVGLRRAGFTTEERLQLRRLYHHLFRSGLVLREALQGAQQEFTTGPALVMLEFIIASKRGICVDHARRSRGEKGDIEPKAA